MIVAGDKSMTVSEFQLIIHRVGEKDVLALGSKFTTNEESQERDCTSKNVISWILYESIFSEKSTAFEKQEVRVLWN